jgi:hypothetical protein
MNPAAAGSSMLFICFLALTAIIAVCLLAYIARCVLVVVEATAAGADRVQWPNEQYIDWIVQSLALIGLAVFLLFPAGILAAALGVRTVYLVGPVLWLLFPIGTLSSLTAEMPWVFFRPVIAKRMVQVLPWTLVFYFSSALAVGMGLGLWYVAVMTQSLALLLLAAPLSGAMVLAYARLLGQLAWRMGQLGPLQEAAPSQRSKRGRGDLLDSATVPSHIPLPIPRAEPDVEPEPGRIPQSPTGLLELENLAPYELATDNSPPQPRQSDPGPERLRPLDAEEIDARNPYAMAEPPPPNPALTTDMFLATLPRSYTQPAAQEEGAMANPSLVGTIAFPFYETSLVALLWLFVGIGLLGLLVMELVQSIPG